LPESSPDIRPEPSSVTVSPTYRSVAVVRVGIAPSLTIIGTLIDSDGNPVANMPGNMLDSAGTAIPSKGMFTDERGVFECYELAPGPLSILWDDGSVLTITVPEGKPGTVVDMGRVSAHGVLQGGDR
jgi:outer membrane usher protein